jgi:hypothetical protein
VPKDLGEDAMYASAQNLKDRLHFNSSLLRSAQSTQHLLSSKDQDRVNEELEDITTSGSVVQAGSSFFHPVEQGSASTLEPYSKNLTLLAEGDSEKGVCKREMTEVTQQDQEMENDDKWGASWFDQVR